jgi:DNA-directed RNA polymerase subunit RPC12/RpoP
MVGPLLVFCAVVAMILLVYVELGSRLSPIVKAWGSIIAVFVAGQFAMAAFRRKVALLSKTHGLVCPYCGSALGFRYATLKRTGKCGACGRTVVSDA